MKILKYEVSTRSECEIEMPFGARILTVQTQYEIPQVWVLADEEAEKVKRKFVTIGTGHEFTAEDDYIGTYQLMDGSLVFHLFEVIDK